MDGPPLNLLFIKLKHYGDVLLMTPVLAAVKKAYPNAHITVVLRKGTESILQNCGLVDAIFTTAAPEKDQRGFSLLELYRLLPVFFARKYDFVFELTDGDRGRWIGALSRAGIRCTCSYAWVKKDFWRYFYKGLSDFNWLLCHRVEKDHTLVRNFLPLLAQQAPPLVLEPAKETHLPISPYAVIHTASRWERKVWPKDRWADVGRYLQKKGIRCIISSGPDQREIESARELQSSIGGDTEITGGHLSWNELGALLRGAKLFVGIDTAAMHVAAASQTPVVALFGPSIEHHWHPWKTRYEIVSPGGPLHHRFPDFYYEGPSRLIEDIHVDEVIQACDRILENSSIER